MICSTQCYSGNIICFNLRSAADRKFIVGMAAAGRQLRSTFGKLLRSCRRCTKGHFFSADAQCLKRSRKFRNWQNVIGIRGTLKQNFSTTIRCFRSLSAQIYRDCHLVTVCHLCKPVQYGHIIHLYRVNNTGNVRPVLIDMVGTSSQRASGLVQCGRRNGIDRSRCFAQILLRSIECLIRNIHQNIGRNRCIGKGDPFFRITKSVSRHRAVFKRHFSTVFNRNSAFERAVFETDLCAALDQNVDIRRGFSVAEVYFFNRYINSRGERNTCVFPGTMRCDNIDIFERTAATTVFSGRNALDSGRNHKACCLSLTANISGCTENHLLNLAHFFSGGISFLNRVKSASRTDISLVIILFLFKCFSKTLFDCIDCLCSTRNCVNICDVVIGSVLTNQLFAHTRLFFCHIAI